MTNVEIRRLRNGDMLRSPDGKIFKYWGAVTTHKDRTTYLEYQLFPKGRGDVRGLRADELAAYTKVTQDKTLHGYGIAYD